MKKKNRTNSYVSNNPMLDAVTGTDLPTIAAESYDAPLPYTKTDSHQIRGESMHRIKYPATDSVSEYEVPPVLFGKDGVPKKDK